MKMVVRRSGPVDGSMFVAGRSRPFAGPITVARRFGPVSDGLRRTSFWPTLPVALTHLWAPLLSHVVLTQVPVACAQIWALCLSHVVLTPLS